MIDNLQPVQESLPFKAHMVAVKGHFRLGKWIAPHHRGPPSVGQKICVLPRGTPIEYVTPLAPSGAFVAPAVVKKAPAVGPSGSFVAPPFTGLGSERFPMAGRVALAEKPEPGSARTGDPKIIPGASVPRLTPVKRKVTVKIDRKLFDDCNRLIDRSRDVHSIGQIIDQALRRYFSGGE